MKYDKKFEDEEKYGTILSGDKIKMTEPYPPDHIHVMIRSDAEKKCVVCGCLTSWTDNGAYICSEECTSKHCSVAPGHRY